MIIAIMSQHIDFWFVQTKTFFPIFIFLITNALFIYFLLLKRINNPFSNFYNDNLSQRFGLVLITSRPFLSRAGSEEQINEGSCASNDGCQVKGLFPFLFSTLTLQKEMINFSKIGIAFQKVTLTQNDRY